VRAAMLTDMGWMGIHINAEANQRNDTVISDATSRVRLLVFKTDEERMLAEHAAELLTL
jgi:acetate kinase